MNALLAKAALMVGQDRGFLTSLQRAQGAAIARDSTWQDTQTRQAVTYARAEAATLDALPALQNALRKAMAAAGHLPSVAATDAKAALKNVRLPSALTSLLRTFGVTAAQVAALKSAVTKASPTRAAGPLAAKIASPALAAVEHGGARLLRALAARLG